MKGKYILIFILTLINCLVFTKNNNKIFYLQIDPNEKANLMYISLSYKHEKHGKTSPENVSSVITIKKTSATAITITKEEHEKGIYITHISTNINTEIFNTDDAVDKGLYIDLRGITKKTFYIKSSKKCDSNVESCKCLNGLCFELIEQKTKNKTST